jgi:hypothetical protein
MEDIKFEGISMKMGGQEYIVPPLSIKGFRETKGQIEALKDVASGMTDEQIDNVVKIIHCALCRNYPDLTLDQTEEMVDLGNMGSLVNAIMGGGAVASPGAKREEADRVCR